MNRTYPSSSLRYRTIDTGKVVIGCAYMPPVPKPFDLSKVPSATF